MNLCAIAICACHYAAFWRWMLYFCFNSMFDWFSIYVYFIFPFYLYFLWCLFGVRNVVRTISSKNMKIRMCVCVVKHWFRRNWCRIMNVKLWDMSCLGLVHENIVFDESTSSQKKKSFMFIYCFYYLFSTLYFISSYMYLFFQERHNFWWPAMALASIVVHHFLWYKYTNNEICLRLLHSFNWFISSFLFLFLFSLLSETLLFWGRLLRGFSIEIWEHRDWQKK